MTDSLSPETIAELREAFQAVDEKGAGWIPTHRLGDLMKSLGSYLTSMELADWMDDAKAQGMRGTISFLEFLDLFARRQQVSYSGELSDAFQTLATPGLDGVRRIHSSELRASILNLGEEGITPEFVDALLLDAAGPDGMVDYEGFVQILMNSDPGQENEDAYQRAREHLR